LSREARRHFFSSNTQIDFPAPFKGKLLSGMQTHRGSQVRKLYPAALQSRAKAGLVDLTVGGPWFLTSHYGW